MVIRILVDKEVDPDAGWSVLQKCSIEKVKENTFLNENWIFFWKFFLLYIVFQLFTKIKIDFFRIDRVTK